MKSRELLALRSGRKAAGFAARLKVVLTRFHSPVVPLEMDPHALAMTCAPMPRESRSDARCLRVKLVVMRDIRGRALPPSVIKLRCVCHERFANRPLLTAIDHSVRRGPVSNGPP
jgi:hypothetical protein